MYQLTLHLLAMILYTGIVRECTFHDVRSLVAVHPLVVVPEAERTVPIVPLNCHCHCGSGKRYRAPPTIALFTAVETS